MLKHMHSRPLLTLPAVLLALAPAIASGQAREPNGDTDSRVTDVGKNAASIELKEATMEGPGETVGTIRVRQLAEGLLFEPALQGLEPGLHGFHIHENGDCGTGYGEVTEISRAKVKPAEEAGEHWDPGMKGNHAGPWGQGHLGDLPNLQVEEDGVASLPVYAPRLSLRDLEERALVVHAKPDNYTDEPDGKGGSGPAVACGVWDQ